MKFRYKLPLQCKDGFDIEDSNGEVCQGTILAVRGNGTNKVATILINFVDLSEDSPLHSSSPPSAGVETDYNYVSGFECAQEE